LEILFGSERASASQRRNADISCFPSAKKKKKIKVPFLYVRRKKKTKFAESWKEKKERDINKDSRSFFISFFIGNTVL
jgi:hypothetical protein